MGKATKKWAKNHRVWIIKMMGGICYACGSKEKLEFDTIEPTGDEHHRMSTDQRMVFYRAQLKKLNVQLLCQKCNARKGDDVVDHRNLFQMVLLKQLAALLNIRQKDPF